MLSYNIDVNNMILKISEIIRYIIISAEACYDRVANIIPSDIFFFILYINISTEACYDRVVDIFNNACHSDVIKIGRAPLGKIPIPCVATTWMMILHQHLTFQHFIISAEYIVINIFTQLEYKKMRYFPDTFS